MPVFMITSQHTAESCPMNNEKERKMFLEASGKMGELTNKHNIKPVGNYVSMPDHTTYMILEAPSSDAFQQFMAEPSIIQMLAKSTSTVKSVNALEDAVKMLSEM